jgi:hypothetical protein
MSRITTLDQRRAERKRSNFTVVVTDTINQRPLGHLGNISATGLLLISIDPPRSEALYQVSLSLPGLGNPPQAIELGLQEQWHEAAATPGQIWSGYRIVSIGDADAILLDAWLAMPGGRD